jgi:LmbE family N-acetylglucosaminyl deacetylase
MISPGEKVLVVAAHPDDEVLGVGGTIAKASSLGIKVSVLFMSTGVNSRDSLRESEDSRIESAKKALKILNVDNFIFGDFPDNAFDSIKLLDLCKFIENYIQLIDPTIVFTHFYNDLNIDHRLTSEATQVAVRPKVVSNVKALLFYEVLSSTNWLFGKKFFSPSLHIDISQTYNLKQLALKAYEAEMDSSPNARSILSSKVLSESRGHHMGYSFAESFEIGFLKY